MAITAERTVVLKGSEVCSATNLALAKSFTEAGAILGLVNLIVASRETHLHVQKHFSRAKKLGRSALLPVRQSDVLWVLKPRTV